MDISVIGCGRWGSFIAWYLSGIGHNIKLYGREGSENLENLRKKQATGEKPMDNGIGLTTSLEEVLKNDMIVISIGSQGLRSLIKEIVKISSGKKTYVLCMKGLEIETGKRLSQIVAEEAPNSETAVWLGPGHVQEFYSGIPNCMVIDSADEMVKERLVESFSSDLIRFYYGQDIIGNEIGAAAKNVIGIAAGMLDALELSSLKGALMSRGTREIARLIKALGGSELSAYGLCHLGDYEATVFSKYSHNRQFGEMLVKGEKYEKLAEGYYTVCALLKLAQENSCSLPICKAVYDVIYNKTEPRGTVNALFSRSLKNEF